MKRNAFIFLPVGDKIVALDADSGDNAPIIVDQNVTAPSGGSPGFAEITIRLELNGLVRGMGAVQI